MKRGKISESVLKRTVIKEIQYKNKAVKKGAAAGGDGAVFATDGRDMASSVSAYTGEIIMSGRRAFAGAVNSLAAMGAEPFAVQVCVLMPESTKESMLRAFMIELHNMGKDIGVQIAGGHTEMAAGIERPVVTVTSYGFVERLSYGKLYNGKDCQEPDNEYDIVMIGDTGLEGTAVLAVENEEELHKRFTGAYIDKAKAYIKELVIVREAAAAATHGMKAMHDTSKGGVFGALWELGENLKCGMEINLRSIPIRQETVELCEYFDLNPYFINSLGGLLVVTEDGEGLAGKIRNMGKTAAVIGRTDRGHQRTIVNNDEKRYLEPPKSGKAEELLEKRI